MGEIITFGNFKGGTGKTTNAVLTAYALASEGKKVLLVDKDPQANSTTILLRTKLHLQKMRAYNLYTVEHDIKHHGWGREARDLVASMEVPDITPEKYLIDGVIEGDLSSCVVPIMSRLDLLPTNPKFVFYPKVLSELFKKETDRVLYFRELISKLKDEYDYILIDVPPTISIFTDAALVASDYTLIIMQTHDASLDGASIFIESIQQLIYDYKIFLDVIGILPVIIKQDSNVDEAVLMSAENIFGKENIFDTKIKMMERLKRYYFTGITEYDYHDANVMKVYTKVANEIINRVELLKQ